VRTALIPIATTLAGIAVEISGYENPTLARYVWYLCVVVWGIWLLTVIPWPSGKSPERRALEQRLAHYRQLGLFIAEGDYLLVRVRHRSNIRDAFPLDWHSDDDGANEIAGWEKNCAHYLQHEYSAAAAERFRERVVRTTALLGDAARLEIRIEYLQSLRNEIFANDAGQ
jgi:hypothetical protein